jgi:uncharacterized protein
MKKMNPVVHFEMPAEDRKRMADFYAKAFGWKTKMLDEKMGNYALVTTGETDKQEMIKNLGNINGGFFPKKKGDPNKYPSVVIAVDNIEESRKNIQDAGGKVVGKPVEIAGYGLYVSFYDTEGNMSSLMQPIMQMDDKKKAVKKAASKTKKPEMGLIRGFDC